jgi:hypothetical protein
VIACFLDPAGLLDRVEGRGLPILAADRAEGTLVRDLLAPVHEEDLERGPTLLGGAFPVVVAVVIHGH